MTNSQRLKDLLDYLILNKKIHNQQHFSDLTGINKTTVSLLLSGKRAIGKNAATAIINSFQFVNYEWLLRGEGSMLKSDDTKPDGQTEKIKSKSGLCWEQMTDGSFLVTVDLVPFEAHGRYLSEDPEYYAEWEQITFNVPKMGRGNYLGFKHKGESMFNPDNPGFYDIKQGMKSLARELGRWHWKDGFRRKDAPYGWILITNKNILHKDITAINLDEGTITCSSRNPDAKYSDFDLELNDVYQIFKIITVNH
jgi:hypothetical protein